MLWKNFAAKMYGNKWSAERVVTETEGITGHQWLNQDSCLTTDMLMEGYRQQLISLRRVVKMTGKCTKKNMAETNAQVDATVNDAQVDDSKDSTVVTAIRLVRKILDSIFTTENKVFTLGELRRKLLNLLNNKANAIRLLSDRSNRNSFVNSAIHVLHYYETCLFILWDIFLFILWDPCLVYSVRDTHFVYSVRDTRFVYSVRDTCFVYSVRDTRFVYSVRDTHFVYSVRDWEQK